MEPWEVAAREELRDLVAAYAHCADTGRFDELVALFADDGVLQTDDIECRGRDAIRTFLGGTKDSLSATTARGFIRHHVSNLWLTVSSPSEANGVCYFFVVTERGPDHWGRYRDAYAFSAGRWRFRHRRVRLDGYSPTSWVAERRTR